MRIQTEKQLDNLLIEECPSVDSISIVLDNIWEEYLNKIFYCLNVSSIYIEFNCGIEGPESMPFDKFAIFQNLNYFSVYSATNDDYCCIIYNTPSICQDGCNVLITKYDIYTHKIIDDDTIINLNIVEGYNKFLLDNLPIQLKKLHLYHNSTEKIIMKNLPVGLEELTVGFLIKGDKNNNLETNNKIPHGCKFTVF